MSIYFDHAFVLIKEDFHLVGHGVIDRQCVALVFQFLGGDEIRQVLFGCGLYAACFAESEGDLTISVVFRVDHI